jgi:tetratricopeptide (TPR) repeat protein/energy-coupling factor transporter ATP-binding protein EcfA2
LRELGIEPESETRQLYRDILQWSEVNAGEAYLSKAAADGDSHRRGAISIATGGAIEVPQHDTALIGRERELTILQGVLAVAETRRGQVLIVVGEAGVGKTTLITALAAEVDRRSGLVLLGRSHESEKILPFGPWVDALRTAQVIRDEQLVSSLNPVWRAELTRLLPEIGSPDLPMPSEDRRRLFDGVTHLLESLASTQPVVLILEDLHWADEMSVRLFSFVGRRLGTSRILVVASVREEELADAPALRSVLQEFQQESHVVQVLLAPLTREDTGTLVRSLVRKGTDEAGIARLARQAWTVSEGNPFTVVETMRALDDGSSPDARDDLPMAERVRQVIATRLERLGPQARSLLPIAAVMGREFDFALLQRAAGVDEGVAAQGVEELVRRRVLHGVGEQLDFVHDRIRAVAYSQLPPLQRKGVHARVAEAIEGLYAENLARHSAALGMHYEHGEIWDKAVYYLSEAGRQALDRSAYHEAVASFKSAHRILIGRPKNHSHKEQTVDVLIGLSNALVPLADHTRALETLHEAEELACAIGDQRRTARVLSAICGTRWLLGSYAGAIESGERALALGVELQDVGIQALTNHRLGQVLFSCGEYRRSAEALTRSIDALEGDRIDNRGRSIASGSIWAFAKIFLAWCHAELGEFQEAVSQAEAALRCADVADHTYTRLQACFGLGVVRLRKGELHAAIEVLERGRALCQSTDAPFQTHLNAASLGYAYALVGRVADGLPLLDDAVEQVTRTGGLFSQSLLLGWFGEAYLLAGRIDDALATASRALDLCRARSERGREVHVLRLLGEVAGARKPADVQTGEDCYRQAIELAQQHGMQPVVAHGHLGLGKLYRRTGKREQANEHLTVATTMYREMGMTYWRQQAQAEMKALT